jgi:hypothetical protein
MMFSKVEYLTQQQRYEDMRREAEHERLLRAAVPQPSHRNPARRGPGSPAHVGCTWPAG